MMSAVRKDELVFHQGSRLTGKWKRTSYTIIRRLGIGMIGTVYLCRAKGKLVALKISKQQMSMTAEVNALRSLNGVHSCHLAPRLFEVDDWVSPNRIIYSFYVMEYIPGIQLDLFIRQRGVEWLVLTLLQLLEEIHKVHEAGFVFGDLKMEHILVEENTLRVRCIDVGGVTKLGRSIKEYSELYDRAYWQLGARIAEPSYDLFAIAMMVLFVYDRQPYKKSILSKQDLLQKSTTIKELNLIHGTIQDALRGKFSSAKAMRQALFKEVLQGQVQRKTKRKSSSRQLGQSMMITCIGALYYVLSLFL